MKTGLIAFNFVHFQILSVSVKEAIVSHSNLHVLSTLGQFIYQTAKNAAGT